MFRVFLYFCIQTITIFHFFTYLVSYFPIVFSVVLSLCSMLFNIKSENIQTLMVHQNLICYQPSRAKQTTSFNRVYYILFHLIFQVSNYTSSDVEVKCQSGFSGGLDQRFIMDVFETVNNTQVRLTTLWWIIFSIKMRIK